MAQVLIYSDVEVHVMPSDKADATSLPEAAPPEIARILAERDGYDVPYEVVYRGVMGRIIFRSAPGLLARPQRPGVRRMVSPVIAELVGFEVDVSSYYGACELVEAVRSTPP